MAVRGQGPAPLPYVSTRNCVACGRSIAWEVNVCPYCGHDYRPQMFGPSKAQPPSEKSSLPLVGGIFLILGGIIGIILGIVLLLAAAFLSSFGNAFGVPYQGITDLMLAMSIIGIGFEGVALVGGVFAVQKKHWAIALIAGILAIIGGIFAGYVSTAFGIIGVILIAISRTEFQN